MPCCPIVWCLPEYLPNCLWWKKDEAFWSFFNMKKKIKQKWSLIIETLVLLVCMIPPLNDIFCNLVWIFWRENILVFLHFFCRKKQFWHMNLTTWLCFSPYLWKRLKKCAIPWRNDFLISWFLITYFLCGLKGHIRDEDYPYAVSYTLGAEWGPCMPLHIVITIDHRCWARSTQ